MDGNKGKQTLADFVYLDQTVKTSDYIMILQKFTSCLY